MNNTIGKKETSSALVFLALPVLILEYSGNSLMQFNSGSWINYLICFALAIPMTLLIKYSFYSVDSKISKAYCKIPDALCVLYIFLLTIKNYNISLSAISSVVLSDTSANNLITPFVMGVSLICALCGIESLTRTSHVCFKVFSVIIALMCLITFKGWDYENIAPVFGNDVKTTFLNFSGIKVFAPAVIIYILSHLFKKESEAYISARNGIIKIFLIGFVIISVCILSVPYPMGQLYKFSLDGIFSIAKSGAFFHRFQIILSFAVVILSVLSSSLGIYLTSYGLSKLSKLSDSKAYCYIIAVILFYFNMNFDLSALLNNAVNICSVILYILLLGKSVLNLIYTKKVKA